MFNISFYYEVNPILSLAILLVIGLAAGRVSRFFGLPAIIGQILVGLVIGSAGINLFSHSSITSLDLITEFAFGLVALSVGDKLNFSRLRNASKRLSFLLISECTILPLFVFVILRFVVKIEVIPVLVFSVLAISTAPATIITLVKERGAHGVFVKTLIAAVALNNIACIVLFEIVRVIAFILSGKGLSDDMLSIALSPIMKIGGAALIGVAVAGFLVLLTNKIVSGGNLYSFSYVALFTVIGLALALQVSVLLSCLCFGIGIANFTPNKDEVGSVAFENIERLVYAVFFVLAGVHLNFSFVISAAAVTIFLVATRLLGKNLSAIIAMKASGATKSLSRYLGLALTPQAGVAIGLILTLQNDNLFLEFHEIILAVGLSAVVINEIVGVFLADFALKKTGESGRAVPRLIDFIHEENIVVNFQPRNKDEAIKQLVSLILKSHFPKGSHDMVYRTVMERELEASTCLGNGLSIPHGRIGQGEEIFGAMGINSRGLNFKTPDNKPVNCMIVLITPLSQSDRHLAVIASIVRMLEKDQNIKSQLYSARSPAHAYNILNAEKVEEYNYFL